MTAKRETGLRQRIAVALRKRGCVVVTQHGGPFGAAHTSDLLVCVPPRGRFVALEVKTDEGRATPGQVHFQEQVTRAGGTAAIVRSVREAVEICMSTASSELDDLFADLGLDGPTAVSDDTADITDAVADPQPVDEIVVGGVEGEGLDDILMGPVEVPPTGIRGEEVLEDTVIETVKKARGRKGKAEPAIVSDHPTINTGQDVSAQIAALDQKFDRIMGTLAEVLEATARIIESARGASGGDPS